MGFRKLLAALLCVVLAGCASSPRQVNLPPVRVLPPEKLERDRIYADKTAGRVALAGAVFGIVGGLVGGGIGAATMVAGQKRFRPITDPVSTLAPAVIQKGIERGLAGTGKLPPATGAPLEVELRLKSVSYGVAHAGRQKFAATVAARYELWDAKGKRISRSEKIANSDIAWGRGEYEADQQLYPRALERAAEALGRDIAAEAIEEMEYWFEE